MNYLHYEFDSGPDDAIEVTLDGQANVRLMDGNNFEKYRSGKAYRYRGGLAKEFTMYLAPPHQGHWHVVIDLGGFPGTVGASVRKMPAAEAVG